MRFQKLQAMGAIELADKLAPTLYAPLLSVSVADA